MKKEIYTNNPSSQIGFGLTAVALILSYCVCACAVTGQGLVGVLLCSLVCTITSLKLRNGIFVPDVFLLVPVTYILSVSSPVCASLSVLSGACIFIAIRKFTQNPKIPSCVIAGASLSLALGITILLTNDYFGIGAMGETPFEMLKSFRYLGFHPNFRGLLYGTITLFTMITFPFKFRKLNKYLPAQFITILIPFILNLFLNPDKKLTTINEADFSPILQSLQNILSFLTDISFNDTPIIFENSLVFALFLYACFSLSDKNEDKAFFYGNALSGTLCGLPLKKHYIRGYGKKAALTAIILIAFCIIFFPNLFSRLPMHCAGSMLIVSAWQNLPYKTIAEVFKSRNPMNILIFGLCVPPLLLFKPYIAIIIYVTLVLFSQLISSFSERKECMK